MSPSRERRKQTLTLFEQVVGLDPGTRAAYLDRACADDPELRREVEALLEAHAEPGLTEELDKVLRASLASWSKASEIQAGQAVSHYRIEERLGGGGMGVVYRARDTKLDRTVALKFLPSHLNTHDEAKQRFILEAKAASALDHANICTIYEIGETADRQLFIAMAYYEGETLKAKIERGPLPVAKALDYALQVAQGLQRAHEAGIVHRDVKPANVLVTERGQVKVLDFGIAKVQNVDLTKKDARVGTVAYMSPEQVHAGKVDHRTDLWSLGVVLYEMLTGKRPFAGEYEQAVLYSILHEEPVPVQALRPNVSDALAQVVEKLLRKEPDERYQRVDACLHGLQTLSALPGATVPGTQQGPHRSRPRRAGYLLGGLAAVVLLLAVSIWMVARQPAQRLETAPPTQAAPAERTKIVVLPFDNLGPPTEAYFAAGVTEEITSRLASISALGVISSNSARHYANTDKSTKQIGTDLGADYVLEGSVRWASGDASANRVLITPKLIRIADDVTLWSEIYDRKIDDIFEIQTEIAQAVVGHLGMTLVEPEREARPTENLEAYQAYLRGRYYAGRPDYTKENRERAVESFQQALDQDPYFTLAYAELSQAHTFMYYLGHDRSEERRALAEQAATRAFELDPESPAVHIALGYYYYRCGRAYDRALEEFTLARQTLSDKTEVLEAMAFVLRRQGRWEEARTHFETAFALDPNNAQLSEQLGRTHAFLRDFPKAVEYCDRSIALAPDQAFAYYNKAWTYWTWTGTTAEAHAALDVMPVRLDDGWYHWVRFWQALYEERYQEALQGLAALPDGWISTRMLARPEALLAAYTYNLLGEPQQASGAYDSARVLLEARVKESPGDPRFYSSLGLAYAGLGRKAEAIQAGQRAVDLLPASKDAYFGPIYVTDLALIYTTVGEYEAALDQIEYLLSIPSRMSVPLLQLDPRWRPLRDHPRFQRLLPVPARIGSV